MDVNKLRPAGTEIMQTLVKGYRNNQGIHAETVIGGGAALAGEFALRAAGIDLPKGPAWVAGGIADPLLYSAGDDKVTMWALLKLGAVNAGLSPEDVPDVAEIVVRTDKAIGQSPFPPLSVGREHFPLEWSPDAAPRFRDAIKSIAIRHQLDPAETALAIIFAIMMLIEETKHLVPVKVTLRLATEIMIGVSRMAPVESPISH